MEGHGREAAKINFVCFQEGMLWVGGGRFGCYGVTPFRWAWS